MATPVLDPSTLPAKLDRGDELLYVQMSFLIVAGISVIIRFYVKTCIVKHHSLDDYLIYGALAGYIAYGSIAMDGVINGATGKHYALGFSMERAARSLRGWYLCMVLYPPTTMAIRTSVCVLLLRLTRTRTHRIIIWANFGIIAVASTVLFFILIFQCEPVSYFWKQVLGGKGYCRDKLLVTYATTVHSAVSALSDWCLGLLPGVLLWNVQINRRTKAIIVLLLSFGMIAGVALVIRIPYISRMPPGLEFIYRSIDVAIWSVVEPALGIIAACVATYRPLFKDWGFGWTPSGRSNSKKAASSSGAMQLSSSRHWTSSTAHRQYARQPNVRDQPSEDEDSILSSNGGAGGDTEMNINRTVSVEVRSETRSSEEVVQGSSKTHVSSPGRAG